QLPVRFRRRAGRGADRRGDWRDRALCPQRLSRKRSLPRARGNTDGRAAPQAERPVHPMTAAPRQLVLDLAHRQALGAEDFLVSSSNEAAIELVDRWPGWPHPACVVAGPKGSGKSHVANVWRLKSGAGVAAAKTLDDAFVAGLPDGGALVVEDLDRGIGDEQ